MTVKTSDDGSILVDFSGFLYAVNRLTIRHQEHTYNCVVQDWLDLEGGGKKVLYYLNGVLKREVIARTYIIKRLDQLEVICPLVSPETTEISHEGENESE